MSSMVFVLSWLLPNHYPPWVNFHSEFLAFTGIFLFLVDLLRKKKRPLQIPGLTLGLVALAAIPWVQYAAGLVVFGGDAFISSVYLIGVATAVVVGYSYMRNGAGVRTTSWFLIPTGVLLAAAILSAMLALLQWLSLTDSLTTAAMHIEPGERVVANLGQPNQLASLLLMGMLSLAFIYERKVVGRWGFLLGIGFMTWVLVLTESRTALLSAATIAIFFLYKLRLVDSRMSGRHVLIWLAVFVMATLALPVVNNLLLMGDPRTTALTDQNGRAEIWRQTIYAIQDSPWFGYGWNQTPAAQAVGALKYPGTLSFTNAHNVVLDLLTWMGLPLGILLTAGGAYWFAIRIKRIKTLEATYAMAILLPVAVHSMLEFPFAYAYFLLTAGLLVGVIEASTTAAPKYMLSNAGGWAMAGVMAVVGGYFCYEYLLVEEDYRFARFESLKVGRTPDDYVRPNIYINTQMAALLTVWRQPALPGMTSAQLESLRQVSLRFGYNQLVYRYALALGLNGNPAGASQQMRVVRGMFGERYYQATKADMRQLAIEKYPQLSAVQLP